MKNFMLYTPTRIIFGKGEENNVGEYLKGYGVKRVLVLHYGTGLDFEVKLMERIFASLDKSGVEYIDFDDIKPNPTAERAEEGKKICMEKGVDFLLPVGGGSVIDTAKYIAMAVKYPGDLWEDYFMKGMSPSNTVGGDDAIQALPVGAIPTIAGTGSECSNSAVITNNGLKRSVLSDSIRPVFALMNPELSYTLPAYPTACGAVDIMAHAHERYFTLDPDNYLTDNLGEAIFKTVIKYLPVALKEPDNYNARAQLLWASVIAHNDSCGVGRTVDGAVHSLQSEIGGRYDSAHGAGVACLTIGWMKYVYKTDMRRFVRYFNAVWGIENDPYDPEGMILKGIERQREFYKSVGIPVHCGELGVKDEDIPSLAATVRRGKDGKTGNFMKLDTKDIINIYRLCE